MTDATKPNMRDNSELWADMTAAIRDIVGNWTDDEIAAVIRKVHSPTPDALLDDLGQVFAWCAAAQELGEDSEEAAAVGLWQHPALPIVITVRDGQVFHQIDPRCDCGDYPMTRDDAPDRIWIEEDDGCPYFYDASELAEAGGPLIEYIRADLATCAPVGREFGAELSGNTGGLIDKMAEAIRGDTTCDDAPWAAPWAVLSEVRKIGWRGDAERALAAVKEYLTAHSPAPVVTTDSLAMARFDLEQATRQIENDHAALMHLCRKHGMVGDLPMQWLDERLSAPPVSARVIAEKAYLAGFNAAGEGYNGEWPFHDKGISPDTDEGWLIGRDMTLAALLPAGEGE